VKFVGVDLRNEI